MVQRILVGLDGSPLAETILPFVSDLAGAFNAEVRLAHVVHVSEDLPVGDRFPTKEALTERAKSQAQSYLEEVRGRLAPSGGSVVTTVLVGDAAEELVNLAQREHSDLIAIATHGRSGLQHLLYGSVAEKVLHTATTPVLLMRPDSTREAAPRKLTHVLVPLDGSPLAETVFPEALELAAGLHLPIVLLRVVEFPMYAVGDPTMGPYADYGELLDILADNAKSYLNEAADRLRNEGATVTAESPLGMPATEITQHVHNHPGALIVLATHGRTGLVGALLGSVARQVLRAQAPTVVVRPVGP